MRVRMVCFVAFLSLFASSLMAEASDIGAGGGADQFVQSSSPAWDSGVARSLLPSGTVSVDIMVPTLPSRAIDIIDKIQTSIANNPTWWIEFTANVPPGEPIPYDPRLGVTEEEYHEFLHLATRMEMAKIGEAPVHFSWLDDDVVQLDGGEALSDLTGIEIDLAAGIISTPFGVLKEHRYISESTTVDSGPGPWQGIAWNLEEYGPDLFSVTIAEFALGRLAESGRGIMLLEAQIVQRLVEREIFYLLYYDLPENTF